MHICLPNIQDWLDWMPMLCQSTFSCNESDTTLPLTDRHAIICYIGNRLANWHSIGRMTLYWQFEVGLAKVAKCPIGTRLVYWHWIDRLALNWHQIGRLAQDWHWIGRLAQDWHWIGQLAPDWRIGTGLADWHRIGNPRSFTRTICPQNLGTSALCGPGTSLNGG